MNEVESESDKSRLMDLCERAKFIARKLPLVRKLGLERGGEFDIDNLVYKVLRREGVLEKVHKVKDIAYDKIWSKE